MLLKIACYILYLLEMFFTKWIIPHLSHSHLVKIKGFRYNTEIQICLGQKNTLVSQNAGDKKKSSLERPQKKYFLMNLIEFFKLSLHLKNYSNSTFLCLKTKSFTFQGWIPLQTFFYWHEKFFETWNHFSRVGINLRRAGKIWLCQERPGELKSYAKNFNKKTNTLWIILFEF